MPFSGLEPLALPHRHPPLTSSSRHDLEHPCHDCSSFLRSPYPCLFNQGASSFLAPSHVQSPCSKKCAFSQSLSFAKCSQVQMSFDRLQTSSCRHLSSNSQAHHLFPKYASTVTLLALSPQFLVCPSQFCAPLLFNQAFALSHQFYLFLVSSLQRNFFPHFAFKADNALLQIYSVGLHRHTFPPLDECTSWKSPFLPPKKFC